MKRDDYIALYEAYDDYSPRGNPCNGLLIAVLKSAIDDLRSTEQEIKKLAEDFFKEESDEDLFSFQSICNHLSLNPKKVLSIISNRLA